MNFVFTGSTPVQILWQGVTIPTAGGSPPQPDLGNGSIVPYSPDDQPITWDKPTVGQIPNILNSVTANDLINSNIPASMITRSVTFNITSGIQFSSNTGTPNINLSAWQNFGGGTRADVFITNISTNNPIGTSDPATDVPYCNSNVSPPCPSFTYTEYNINEKIFEVQAIPWNECGAIACSNFQVRDFGMTAQMKITLSVACIPNSTLDSDFCLSYCLDNLAVCKQSYQDFCFAPISGATGTDANISGSTGCQTFFTDYYTTAGFGPEASIDNQINAYCAEKYKSLGFAIFNTTPPSDFDKKLCACHMPQKFYDEYKQSIASDFPNFINFIDNSGINEKCLLSYCASSPFSSTDIKKGDTFGCQVPACIQVVEFNNNGSINGKVKIDQNNSTCVAINSGATGSNGGGGGGGTTTTSKSWWEQHWLWLVLGISLLVVLIIVILIIIAAEGSKKKPPYKK